MSAAAAIPLRTSPRSHRVDAKRGDEATSIARNALHAVAETIARNKGSTETPRAFKPGTIHPHSAWLTKARGQKAELRIGLKTLRLLRAVQRVSLPGHGGHVAPVDRAQVFALRDALLTELKKSATFMIRCLPDDAGGDAWKLAEDKALTEFLTHADAAISAALEAARHLQAPFRDKAIEQLRSGLILVKALQTDAEAVHREPSQGTSVAGVHSEPVAVPHFSDASPIKSPKPLPRPPKKQGIRKADASPHEPGALPSDAEKAAMLEQFQASSLYTSIRVLHKGKEDVGMFTPRALMGYARQVLNDPIAIAYANARRMSLEDAVAIRLYGREGYHEINRAHRDPGKGNGEPPIVPPHIRAICKAIDGGMGKLPELPRNEDGQYVVYRGTSFWPDKKVKPKGIIDKAMNRRATWTPLEAGDTYRDLAYLSATTREEVAIGKFGQGGRLLKFTLGPGVPAKDISRLTGNHAESEVLIPRGVRFRVDAVQVTNEKTPSGLYLTRIQLTADPAMAASRLPEVREGKPKRVSFAPGT